MGTQEETLDLQSERSNEGPNLLWMKLAVAVAVIRSKPTSITAKQHAENLHSHFFLTQSKLLEKFSIVCGALELPSANEEMGTSSLMTPPSSSENTSSFFHPMCVGPSNHVQLDHHGWEDMRFSRSVTALRDLSQQASTSYHKDVHTTAVSQLQAMRGVLERGLVRLSEVCLCHSAHAVISVITAFPWLSDEALFMQEVCGFVEFIIHALTVQPAGLGQYPAHRQKHSLVNMLLVFIEHGPLSLTLSVVEQLTESLEKFCTSLKQSQVTGILVSSDLFENSYFTIQCIELTMDLWRKDCPIYPKLLHDIQTRLIGCLMDIADRFPLVAQAVRRVTSIMEAILQNW